MIANALGANAIAIDITDEKLEFARSIGAVATVNARKVGVIEAVREISEGGVHVSIDALGSVETCINSIANLRKRGKHVQIGLMVADYKHPPVPMDLVVANELEILGSHGMQAYKYRDMLAMISSGKLQPAKLIDRTITLEESLTALPDMHSFRGTGVTVIDRF
jgi:alcohol dehydrogenase